MQLSGWKVFGKRNSPVFALSGMEICWDLRGRGRLRLHSRDLVALYRTSCFTQLLLGRVHLVAFYDAVFDVNDALRIFGNVVLVSYQYDGIALCMQTSE